MDKGFENQLNKDFKNKEFNNQDNSSSWKKMWHNIFGINNGQAVTVYGDIHKSTKSRMPTPVIKKRKTSRHMQRKSTLLINKSFLEPENLGFKEREVTNSNIASAINILKPVVLPNCKRVNKEDKLKGTSKPVTIEDYEFHDYARFTKGRVLAKMFRRVRREVKHERVMQQRKKGKITPTNQGNVLVRVRVLTKPEPQDRPKRREVGPATKRSDIGLNAESPSYHELEMKDFRSPRVMKLKNKERVLKSRKALRLERGVRIALKKGYKKPILPHERKTGCILNGKMVTGRRIKLYKLKQVINPNFKAESNDEMNFESNKQEWEPRECHNPTPILEEHYKRVGACQELVPFDPLWSHVIPIKPQILTTAESTKFIRTPESTSLNPMSEKPLPMQPPSLQFQCTKVVKRHLNTLDSVDYKYEEWIEHGKSKGRQGSTKLPSKAVSALSYPFQNDAKLLDLASFRHKRKYSELSVTKSVSKNLLNELAMLKAKRDAKIPNCEPVKGIESSPKFEVISKKVSSYGNIDKMSSTLTQMVDLIRENKELIETVMDAEKNIDHARAEILLLKGRLRDYDHLLTRYDEIIDNVVKLPDADKDSLNDQPSITPKNVIAWNINDQKHNHQDTENFKINAITDLLEKNLDSLKNHQELLIKAINVETRLLAVLEDENYPSEERKIPGIIEYIRRYFESATQMVNLDNIKCMVRVLYNEMMEYDKRPVPSNDNSGPRRDPSFFKLFD